MNAIGPRHLLAPAAPAALVGPPPPALRFGVVIVDPVRISAAAADPTGLAVGWRETSQGGIKDNASVRQDRGVE